MHFTDQFPVLNNYTYLNTANSGILSRSVQEWRAAHDQAFVEQGSLFRLNQESFLNGVRSNVANFFNAKEEGTFLVPNFSYGFNIVLEGLSGQQRFLLLQEDYPSINYPVASRGHVCEYLEVDENLEQNILESIRQFKPTVFAFSIVQYISGIKIDLGFVKKLKAEFPELLFIADGTQYCGTEMFGFEQSGIDILIASSYKWMLGGYGNGFVLLNRQAKNWLYSNAQQWPLPNEPFLKSKNTLAMYFEPGHLDTLNFGSLQQSISYLEQLGLQETQSRILHLSQLAKAAFTQRELLRPAVVKREEHSSIFNLGLPAAFYKHLEQEGIICSNRGSGIRVSFHFYNTEEELNRLLKIIDNRR
jgi:selenocysteine lyase/cysteine desulfurase